MFIATLLIIAIVVIATIINKMISDLYPQQEEVDGFLGSLIAKAMVDSPNYKNYARLRTIKRTGTNHKNGKYFVS